MAEINQKGAVALANIFCWAAALLYAQMVSKPVTFSIPFFINAVYSQASFRHALFQSVLVSTFKIYALFNEKR